MIFQQFKQTFSDFRVSSLVADPAIFYCFNHASKFTELLAVASKYLNGFLANLPCPVAQPKAVHQVHVQVYVFRIAG